MVRQTVLKATCSLLDLLLSCAQSAVDALINMYMKIIYQYSETNV